MGITKYEERYGQKYTVKIDNLENQIIHNVTDTNTFKVINIEAGLGKSVETNRIIHDYLMSFQFGYECFGQENRKFLIVKPFAKDVIETEKSISGEEDILNNHWRQAVIGITKDNWQELRYNESKLLEADVIIITHARYKILCSDTEIRSLLTEGRHTLIIDERIDFPKYSFSLKTYKEMMNILPFSLHGDLHNVCLPLFNEMERIKSLTDEEGKAIYNKKVMKAQPRFMKKHEYILDRFISVLNENLHYILSDYGEDGCNKARMFMDTLEVLYGDKCFFNNGTLTGYNRNHKLWGLKNNIILDANGQFERLYASDDKWDTRFVINKQSKIINHSYSTITHVRFNSSAKKIEDNEEQYFDKVVELLKQNYRNGIRILIVLQKKFIINNGVEGSFIRYLRKAGINDIFIGSESEEKNISIQDERFAVNWFGNIIGKNEWRDFDQCWIIGTPNVPMETHVVNLAQYSAKQWSMGMEMVRRGNGYVFKNDSYEQIRKGYIVGEIYQSIKRIQRNDMPKGQFFIVNHDEEVFKTVANQLKSIRVMKPVMIELEQKDEEGNTVVKENAEAVLSRKVVTIILGKPKGDYTKTEIAAELGVDKNNLYRYLNKNNAIIKSYIDAGEFAIGHHKVTRF